MADTTTTYYALTKPEVGASTDTWGNKTNVNWDLVDAAINNVASTIVPSGTLMLFVQTAAPTGWTKSVAHDDKALRVVSGTVSSGGSSAFSTVFGKTATDAHTLTTSEMPSHTHGVTDPTHGHASSTGNAFLTTPGASTAPGGAGNSFEAASIAAAATGISIVAAGSGGSHTHPIDIRVQYVDVIICTRD